MKISVSSAPHCRAERKHTLVLQKFWKRKARLLSTAEMSTLMAMLMMWIGSSVSDTLCWSKDHWVHLLYHFYISLPLRTLSLVPQTLYRSNHVTCKLSQGNISGPSKMQIYVLCSQKSGRISLTSHKWQPHTKSSLQLSRMHKKCQWKIVLNTLGSIIHRQRHQNSNYEIF